MNASVRYLADTGMSMCWSRYKKVAYEFVITSLAVFLSNVNSGDDVTSSSFGHCTIHLHQVRIDQLTEAVEYVNCISAEG